MRTKNWRGKKQPLKKGILGSFYFFNLTKKFSSVSWKWLMAVGWELLGKVDMNFYAVLDWWVYSGCQPNTCGYTTYSIWEGEKYRWKKEIYKIHRMQRFVVIYCSCSRLQYGLLIFIRCGDLKGLEK